MQRGRFLEESPLIKLEIPKGDIRQNALPRKVLILKK